MEKEQYVTGIEPKVDEPTNTRSEVLPLMQTSKVSFEPS